MTKVYTIKLNKPKDKQIINTILNVLNSKGKNDIASSSKKTWAETKKEYEKIKAEKEETP